MKDRGKVTVFLCLLTTAFVLLGTTMLKVISFRCAKAKAAIVTKISMSDIKANYNSYIFENYHILLFDINAYGQGEGAIEERMLNLTRKNAGDSIVINDVQITGYTTIYENNCAELKEQINDSILYQAAGYGIDTLKEKIGDNDGTYSNELENKLNNVNNIIAEVEDESDEESGELFKPKDPRSYTTLAGQDGFLLMILMPPDAEISTDKIITADALSRMYGQIETSMIFDNSFNDYDKMCNALKNDSTWGTGIDDKAKEIMYIADVFKCFTDETKSDEHALACEIEYIIAGRTNDYDNLEKTCKKLIGLRLPINLTYLLSDVSKMNLIKTISVPLASVTLGAAEPVIRYLIAGAWAYIESMAEVKNLLAGNRVEFVKNSSNWITDLFDVSGSISKGVDSDKGLTYKEYLMILLAMTSDSSYFRILDVIDINTKLKYPEFDIKNAVTKFEADFYITYLSKNISTHQAASY